ncbi:MAG: histidinol-phosphate aminotransferase family protein [Spirochaetes bacterium]|nr:histidinol-phosphate aminotransferase family protein [Spirochaetota bacterium]
MIYLDKNENQYGPSEKCKEVIKNITLEMFNSYSRGYPKKILNRLEKEFGVPGDKILLGYGAEDILKQVFYFVGDHQKKSILMARQAWWYYNAIAEEVNAEIHYFDMVEKKHSFEYDAARAIELMEKHRPTIVLICSPNNPTGNSISRSDLKKIVKKSISTNSFIIIDEAYWGYDGTSNHSLKLVKDYNNVLVLRTFSKFYALAGLRIGFGFAGSQFTDLIKFNMRYLGFNSISEHLTFSALDSKKYYLKIAKLVNHDKKRYFKELTSVGLKVFKSEANFILVKIPEKYIEPLKTELQKEGVLVRFFDKGAVKNTARITIGTVEQNDIAIELIKAIIEGVDNNERWLE